MIKNLLFDMGGVIFQQDTPEAVRRFRQAGLDPEKYMGEYGQKEFFLEVETGQIDASAFCSRMAEATGRDSVSYEEARYCWLGFIRSVEQQRLECLAELRKSYHLCLLTNTNPFIMDYMRSPESSTTGIPVAQYFDSLFCSHEMQLYKPHPDFFHFALTTDGMKAEECVFIDDSLKNVRAAESVGIRGRHVEQNADWRPALAELLA